MKIDPVAELNGRAAGAVQLLLFEGGGDFAARLTLGQILKGRVLRSYDGQRYAVEFDGQRKVVDSAVPLTTGEIVRGRVIGLGERVTLQRIGPGSTESAAPGAQNDLPAAEPREGVGGAVAALFERHQAKIDPAELGKLQRLAQRTPAPEKAALAGLVLNKLGLQVSAELFRAVYGVLAKADNASLFALPGQAFALPAMPLVKDSDALAGLATWLERAVVDVPEARLREARGNDMEADVDDEGRGEAGGSGNHDIARWILNAQTGGAVAHRVATIPLLLDGELVELDVALFAQNDDAQRERGEETIRHRELVFALSTAELGRVEIRATLANGHLRLRIAAESSATTQSLAERAGDLAGSLQRLGWQVDEQRYESKLAGAPGIVAASVVEHLIAPGSVSRLA